MFFGKIKYWDKTLAVTCLLLLLVGLSLLYSIALNGNNTFVVKQSISAGIALTVFLFFAYFDFRTLTRMSRYAYIIGVIMLLVLLEMGLIVKGSSRWFDLGIFNFQPAEFMKLVMVLVLARFFALRRGEINTWKNIALSFIYALIPMFLIAKQPDLGSAIVIFVIWGGMLFFSTVQKKVFIYLLIAFLAFGTIAWNFLLHDYQKSRIETFIDPNLDPRGRGYNVRQATIAIGSGGIMGRGLGKGLQSQLRFLPERQTDFIFASASEELGFIGAFAIIVLYFILLYRLLAIYRLSRDDLSRFLIVGIFFMILSQVVINIGMNMGIMPVTGIPLPMLSYGGSSLLTIAMSIGIAESVAVYAKGLRL